ncbi:uncharacterized protein [Hetaerina americana]
MNPELGFAVCPAMENYFRPLSLLREMNSPSPIGVFRTMVAPNASSQMAYSSTSLISPGPQGCQMVYKATSSARSGPGDVCEIHDSVYNGSSGTKRRRTGRHYRNRSHIVEQGDNLMPGFREHKVGLSNIGNDEVSEFVEEYQRKAPWHTESSNAAPWPDYTERGHHMAFITSPTSPALLSSRPGRVWKYIPRSRSNGDAGGQGAVNPTGGESALGMGGAGIWEGQCRSRERFSRLKSGCREIGRGEIGCPILCFRSFF